MNLRGNSIGTDGRMSTTTTTTTTHFKSFLSFDFGQGMWYLPEKLSICPVMPMQTPLSSMSVTKIGQHEMNI